MAPKSKNISHRLEHTGQRWIPSRLERNINLASQAQTRSSNLCHGAKMTKIWAIDWSTQPKVGFQAGWKCTSLRQARPRQGHQIYVMGPKWKNISHWLEHANQDWIPSRSERDLTLASQAQTRSSNLRHGAKMKKYMPLIGAHRPRLDSKQVRKEPHFCKPGPDRVTKFMPEGQNGKI